MKIDCMTNTPYTIQQVKILLKMGTAKKVEYLFLRDDKMFFPDKE